jgi:hypothetical protein
MNGNWPRWVLTSIEKHFNDNRGTLTMFIEGQHRNTDTLQDFMELRTNGPHIIELSRNYFNVGIEVNVLLHSVMNDQDAHKLRDNIGLVVAIFTDIIVYKYGDNAVDDGTILTCLRLKQNPRGIEGDRLTVSNFGQIKPSIKLQQATIEGHYETDLEE